MEGEEKTHSMNCILPLPDPPEDDEDDDDELLLVAFHAAIPPAIPPTTTSATSAIQIHFLREPAPPAPPLLDPPLYPSANGLSALRCTLSYPPAPAPAPEARSWSSSDQADPARSSCWYRPVGGVPLCGGYRVVPPPTPPVPYGACRSTSLAEAKGFEAAPAPAAG